MKHLSSPTETIEFTDMLVPTISFISPHDQLTIARALLDPPEPSEALIRAVASYRDLVKSG